MWTVLGAGPKARRGWTVRCRCDCGKEKDVAYADLRANGTHACKSCAIRLRMEREMRERGDAVRRHLTRAAAIRAHSNVSKYEPEEKRIAFLMSGAKSRCTNKKSPGYEHYGARGIEFRFPSVEEAARWVFKTLGPRPTEDHSLDRVDNRRHYEPGNLRWATREEQARNRGAYTYQHNSYRVLWLQTKRPDCSILTIRRYCKLGWPDSKIIKEARSALGRPKKC